MSGPDVFTTPSPFRASERLDRRPTFSGFRIGPNGEGTRTAKLPALSPPSAPKPRKVALRTGGYRVPLPKGLCLGPPSKPTEGQRLLTAVNRSDRAALLAARGPAAIFCRAVARGEPVLIEDAARKLRPLLEEPLTELADWLLKPERTRYWRTTVAQYVLGPNTPGLASSAEREAFALSELHSRGEREEWERRAAESRAAHPREARLMIEEAWGRTWYDRPRAWHLLAEAFREHPHHFTIAQMLAEELWWASFTDAEPTAEVEAAIVEALPPLEALLARDPDDLRLAVALTYLHLRRYRRSRLLFLLARLPRVLRLIPRVRRTFKEMDRAAKAPATNERPRPIRLLTARRGRPR